MGAELGYQLADGSWSYQYKIGDKFVVVEGDGGTFTKGSVIEFIRDDSSWCPLFELVEGECKYVLGRGNAKGAFEAWADLIPYEGQQSLEKNYKNVVTVSQEMYNVVKGSAEYLQALDDLYVDYEEEEDKRSPLDVLYDFHKRLSEYTPMYGEELAEIIELFEDKGLTYE